MKNKFTLIFLGIFTFFNMGIINGQVIDLKISIKCLGNVFSGQDLKNTIKVYVTNAGEKTARNFPVDLIISKNNSAPKKYAVYSASFKEDALLLGGREFISSLAPGQTKSIKLNGKNRIPADSPTGFYFLGAIVDAGNKLPETNENNNMDFCRIKIKRAPVLSVLKPQTGGLNRVVVSERKTKRIIRGCIMTAAQKGVAGIIVRAFYYKEGSAPMTLGIANTDKRGYYVIDYTHLAEQSISETYIDLQVKCYDKSKRLLVESDLIRNAPPVKSVNLIIPD